MAREHLELLLLQEGDTHNITTKQAKPLPIPRTCEDTIAGDGEEEQGSKQVVFKRDDQNIMVITIEEMANHESCVKKKKKTLWKPTYQWKEHMNKSSPMKPKKILGGLKKEKKSQW